MTITIKLDDGSILYSNGADAQQVWNWWAAAEQFAIARGATYSGPKLRRVDCITQVDSVPVDALSIQR